MNFALGLFNFPLTGPLPPLDSIVSIVLFLPNSLLVKKISCVTIFKEMFKIFWEVLFLADV